MSTRSYFSGFNKIALVYPLIVLFATSTLVNSWISISARTWIWLIVGIATIPFVISDYFRCKQSSFVLIYGLIVVFNFIIGDGYYSDLPKVINEIGALVLVPAVCYYCISRKADNLSKLILFVFYGALICTTIGTIVVDNMFPGAVRYAVESVNHEKGEEVMISQFYRFGMEDYILPHALPMLIPVLMMGVKKKNIKKKYRLLFCILLLAIIILIWLSGSTTAFLFAPVFLGLSLLSNSNKSNKIGGYVFPLLIFMPLMISTDIQIRILDLLIDLTATRESAYKFTAHLLDMRYSLLMGDDDGAVTSRVIKYNETMEYLFDNILLGTNKTLGGHSAVLDRFATLGVIGIVPMIGFFVNHIRNIRTAISPNAVSYYIWSVIAGIAMMTAKNMFNVEIIIVMCLILPLTIRFITDLQE